MESAQNAELKLVNTDVGYSPGIILQGKTNAADNLIGRIVGNWDDDSSPVAQICFESGVDTSNKDDGIISFWTSDASDTPDERMRIDQNGNVGIGVAPSSLVHASADDPVLTIADTANNSADGDVQSKIKLAGRYHSGTADPLANDVSQSRSALLT